MKLATAWSIAALFVTTTAAQATGLLSNASQPLSITLPSFTGYANVDQFVHPDVVRRPGWNGKHYWMVLTPYPGGQEPYENPSIVAGNDSVTFAEPSGIQNPVANGLPGNCPGGYTCHNNDGDILFKGDTLMMFYNETVNSNGSYTDIKRLYSTNGVSWSSPQTVIHRSNYPLSPAVIYENNLYTMWFVHSTVGCGSSQYPETIKRRRSANGIDWSQYAEDDVTITGNSGIIPWHLDVVRDGGKFVMVYVGYPSATGCGSMALYYAESLDGLNWTASSTPLIEPSASGWDSPVVYRSSVIANGGYLKVWYSARTSSSVWKVGYTQGTGPDLTAPAAVTDLGIPVAGKPNLAVSWTAPGEDGDYGQAVEYDLRRSTTVITEANFTSATRITTPTPSVAGSHQCVLAGSLSACVTYYFALKTKDEAGNWSAISNVPHQRTECTHNWFAECDYLEKGPSPVTETDVALDFGAPHPNPSNGTTSWAVSVPRSFEGARLTSRVYDVAGRCVRTVVDERVS